jgi:gluconolactonase
MLWAFDLEGPGRIRPNPKGGVFTRHTPAGGHFLYRPAGFKFFDSLAVDGDGNICIGTLGDSGISVVSPAGELVDFVAIPHDPMPTNICFGGPDLRTAYVTLSATGRLMAMDWPRAGLRLNYT